jgi:HSP20 family protein
MAKRWHRKITLPKRVLGAAHLEGFRRFMNWDPFLDLDVAKQAREAKPMFTPTFDILEHPGGYVFLADLPGLRPEHLDITWTDGRITVAGTREPEAQGEGADYYALERTFGSFSRSFSLPAGMNADQASAELRDGVLTLLLPKASAGSARIPVQGGQAHQAAVPVQDGVAVLDRQP